MIAVLLKINSNLTTTVQDDSQTNCRPTSLPTQLITCEVCHRFHDPVNHYSVFGQLLCTISRVQIY